MKDYSDLHKALDEAAYEILLAHRRRNSQEIDRLHAENDKIDDEIERREMESAA